MTKRKQPATKPVSIIKADTPEHVAELERLDAAGRLASGASYPHSPSRFILREIPLPFHSPQDALHIDNDDLPVTVGHFWQWLASDLLNNTLRGKLVEFAIGYALGALDGARVEWSDGDLRHPRTGCWIEVKSSAYVQSWGGPRLSKPMFGIAPKRLLDPETDAYPGEPCRPAVVYVFALLTHMNRDTIDPTNLAQYQFYIVPTVRLPPQKVISLATLKKLAEPTEFGHVSAAIDELLKRLPDAPAR